MSHFFFSQLHIKKHEKSKILPYLPTKNLACHSLMAMSFLPKALFIKYVLNIYDTVRDYYRAALCIINTG